MGWYYIASFQAAWNEAMYNNASLETEVRLELPQGLENHKYCSSPDKSLWGKTKQTSKPL